MSDELLVIGYGNPLRGDDGVGPAVSGAIAVLGLPGVRALSVHQLTPELAAEAAGARVAVFVDAAVDSTEVEMRRLEIHAVACFGLVFASVRSTSHYGDGSDAIWPKSRGLDRERGSN